MLGSRLQHQLDQQRVDDVAGADVERAKVAGEGQEVNNDREIDL